jgi:hypothetical protein
MGPDMWLLRTQRVPELSVDGYVAAENAVAEHGPAGLADPALLADHPLAARLAPAARAVTISAPPGQITVDLATQTVDVFQVTDDSYTYHTLFERVITWRKANAIHRWFVEQVHGGADDGYWCAEVDEPICRRLLDTVTQVLADPLLAPRLLPTQGEFFFGGTDYDVDYLTDLTDTRDGLRAVLATTDFGRDIPLYHCWW